MVDDATRKAHVLIEALPYLKRFHGRTMVVKIGGEPIENELVLDALLTDLVFLEQVGVQLVLVHGGGASITKAMEAAGLTAVFSNGRRVTDTSAMAIVVREVERLNQHIVNRIIALGGAAIGMCPPRHMPVRGGVKDPALGLVGQPTSIDRERLERYTSRGLIPIVPPLSVSDDGRVLNTNADDIALAVARGMAAEKLVFMSNVPGVMTDPNDPTTLISSLTAAQIHDLVSRKIIQGGMIPKVENCIAALKAGVGKIHILGAAHAHAILLEIFTTAGIGTELRLGEVDDDDSCIPV